MPALNSAQVFSHLKGCQFPAGSLNWRRLSPCSSLRTTGHAFSVQGGSPAWYCSVGQFGLLLPSGVAVEMGLVPSFCVLPWWSGVSPISPFLAWSSSLVWSQPMPAEQPREVEHQCCLRTGPAVAILPALVFGPWASSAHQRRRPDLTELLSSWSSVSHTCSRLPQCKPAGQGGSVSTWPF